MLNHYARKTKPFYIDLKLYQEIIFLQTFAKKQKWIVENTRSHYTPLIKPEYIGKHYIWSNFNIPLLKERARKIKRVSNQEREKRKGLSLKGIKMKHRKDQILNNCVEPELGQHILNAAYKKIQQTLL